MTHASLWSLQGFHGTTDAGLLWEREFGEQDLRVPISEAVTLWTDLMRHGASARRLYLPDEHHWVVRPVNTRLGCETVLALLAEQLRDEPFLRPALL